MYLVPSRLCKRGQGSPLWLILTGLIPLLATAAPGQAGGADPTRVLGGGPGPGPGGLLQARPVTPRHSCDPRTPISSLPFTINQCGSYYLTDCLDGSSGQHGIIIRSDDVTIDLNGFSLVGGAGSLDGITVEGARTSLQVFGGTIANWGEDGLDASSADTLLLQDLRAHGNGGFGMRAATRTTIVSCHATSNIGPGFELTNGCAVRDSHAALNGGDGFRSTPVLNNVTLTSCTSIENGANGYNFDHYSVLSRCMARGNSLDGIRLSTGGVVESCTSKGNGGDGIEVASSVIIKDCTVQANVNGAGIKVSINSGSVEIRNNRCSLNLNGIELEPQTASCRIDSNDICCSFGVGLLVAELPAPTSNLIIRNTFIGNATNYDIAPSNSWGPFVNVQGVGLITGTPGHDHPWANFLY